MPAPESQLALANADRIAGGRLLIVGFDASVAEALSPATVFHQNLRAHRSVATLPDTHFGAWFTSEQPYDTALVELPKATERLRMDLSMAAAALRPGGRLVLIGRNDAGVKSAGRHLTEIVGENEVLDFRFHARALLATLADRSRASTLDSWEIAFTAEVAGRSFVVHDFPGVFSHGRVDEGTRRLLEVLHVDAGARVLDVGCGNGMIGAWLAAGDLHCDSVDVDAVAVEAASRTTGNAWASDVYSDVQGPYDVIVTNPPFHSGVRTTSATAVRMIEDAPRQLARGGEMWLVANRFLDYATVLKGVFDQVDVKHEDSKFRAYRARHPSGVRPRLS
ncbi:MAG: methyltransferase [Actinomycetota bacterium]